MILSCAFFLLLAFAVGNRQQYSIPGSANPGTHVFSLNSSNIDYNDDEMIVVILPNGNIY